VVRVDKEGGVSAEHVQLAFQGQLELLIEVRRLRKPDLSGHSEH
jgi:hypothetical protein